MAPMRRSWALPLIILILIIILILLIFCRTSCCKLLCRKSGHLKPDVTSYVEKISLNVLFKENVPLAQKNTAIENIKDSVIQFYSLYNEAYGTDFTPVFDSTVWCPCDSALYNINFVCITGSGKSASSPPPTGSIGGSGGLVDVQFVSYNNPINESPRGSTDTIGDKVSVRNIPPDPTKIFAIIDSGLDTTLFTYQIQNLIWTNPTGATTLYNFLPFQPVSNFYDSGIIKHGSAVTALAIRGMDISNSYPRLMILRALDRNDSGSIFSVSCALSYAVQNHATIVNASLGYMGLPDSILRHYVELAHNHPGNPVQLFLAAGNAPHNDSAICSPEYNNNLLSGPSLFYPACFSNVFDNITSVTQIRSPEASCRYQYFSRDYISLGMLDPNRCCSYSVPFTRHDYEGSSFATPLASGLKMATMINTGDPGPGNSMWISLLQTSPSAPLTKDGKYISR